MLLPLSDVPRWWPRRAVIPEKFVVRCCAASALRG